MGNTYCILGGCIDQASVGVIEKWGRFEKLAEPGLHCFNPLAGQFLAGILSTRINSLDVKIETKTKVNLIHSCDSECFLCGYLILVDFKFISMFCL